MALAFGGVGRSTRGMIPLLWWNGVAWMVATAIEGVPGGEALVGVLRSRSLCSGSTDPAWEALRLPSEGLALGPCDGDGCHRVRSLRLPVVPLSGAAPVDLGRRKE